VSIVPLVRVTLYGVLDDKAQVLADLQGLGCLHLVPLAPGQGGRGIGGPSPEAREALKYLLACRQRRHQVRDPAGFDAAAVQIQALAVRDRVREREDERDALVCRIADLEPWGDFRLPPPDALGGLRLWFYQVPLWRLREVAATDLAWAEVERDNRFAYVVVVAEREPRVMPVPRVHSGDRPLSELERRLEAVELELEDLQAERASLTRWCTLLARSLDRLEDEAERTHAASRTHDDAPLFAVRGWVPAAAAPQVAEYAEAQRLALTVEDPAPGDDPPTLLVNRPGVAGGQDLVQFFTTPGYRTWDPSAVVFFSFAVFFAMILSDAGYAALLGLGLALVWRRLGAGETGRRLRALFAWMVAFAAAWGVLVGSYLGVEPAPGSIPADFDVIDVGDYDAMMRLSILVGIGHVLLANLAFAWERRREARSLASLGWAVMVLGGTAYWLGGEAGSAGVVAAAPWLLGAGAIAVVLFTRPGAGPVRRLLGGLLALTQVTSAFGDVLSYLRLFALGLASASLALAFNGLAGQVAAVVPGVGVLLAILVLLIGHGLNFALAVMSGFVHGLRLNFIEFFRWSVPEEGHPFRPFARRAALRRDGGD